jgi:hypothetical protein
MAAPSPGEREFVERIGPFFEFVQAEYGEEHVRRWEDYRAKACDTRAAGDHE